MSGKLPHGEGGDVYAAAALVVLGKMIVITLVLIATIISHRNKKMRQNNKDME